MPTPPKIAVIIAKTISNEHSTALSFFCCAQILFAEVEMLFVLWGELKYLDRLMYMVRGVSMSPLCVTAYRTVWVALMKWTVLQDPVRHSMLPERTMVICVFL